MTRATNLAFDEDMVPWPHGTMDTSMDETTDTTAGTQVEGLIRKTIHQNSRGL